MLDFSVVINTRDHPAELRQCLAALQKQTYDPPRWEIVVVDDGSRGHATEEVVSAHQGPVECRLVRIEPCGRSGARNAGIRAAQGFRVLFMGDDIVAEPDLLKAHAEAHAKHARAAVVGYRTEKSRVPSSVFLSWWDNLRYQDIRDPENATFAFFYTCNCSVERQALLNVGGLDENFTCYGWEDLDLGLRLEKQGFRVVYEPRARAAHHHPNVTLDALCRREYEMAFTSVYFFNKWPNEPLVQGIPFWREAASLGPPGPGWRKDVARGLIGTAETVCPLPALLRLLYRRLVWACRAQGLQDGRAHYAPLLRKMRIADYGLPIDDQTSPQLPPPGPQDSSGSQHSARRTAPLSTQHSALSTQRSPSNTQSSVLSPQSATLGFDIVCLSHLAWEQTLFQRPQQIMRALSKRHRVLYLGHISTRAYLRALAAGERSLLGGKCGDNLIYRNLPYFPFTKRFPRLRLWRYSCTTRHAVTLAREHGLRNPVLWVYHPGYAPFLDRLSARALVYDCMDQFTAFAGARSSDGALEKDLIQRADLVFTGGKSLQRAKEGTNPETHCFPSGVDVRHFAQATEDSTPIAADIAPIRHPILGYFGAVDERIDFDLIRYLCEKRPDWSVVFIGPLVRFAVCPVVVPNFHYLGKKEYRDLPRYLKAFDVCLMPFVNSDLTRHISPTKTPEYLAGEKPVVSSPVPDVVQDYADVVRIGATPEAFLRQVENALHTRANASPVHASVKGRVRSWEQIAQEMEQLLLAHLPETSD
jgi:GT2 family glycosyltransferase/glycosyltransferase involved in cell wall biosynthesis